MSGQLRWKIGLIQAGAARAILPDDEYAKKKRWGGGGGGLAEAALKSGHSLTLSASWKSFSSAM